MAKVIDRDDVWYQEVAPRSFYDEDDLERAIIQNLEIIFPQFKAILFKLPLEDIGRSQRNIPDLAMIKADYSEWYIIEVELGKHSKSHVVNQMETFYNCGYTDVHAEYIYNQRPYDLNLDFLKDMIAKKLPEFMVIVNEHKPDWVTELKKLRCKTCVFQIFHDFDGKPLFRLNGEHPYIYTNFCHCKYQKATPYAVEVLEKTFLDSYNVFDGNTITIEYKGLNVKWERQDAANRIFLHANYSKPPLDPLTDRYRLNYNDKLNSFNFTKD